ncbi:MAG TPA: acyl-CoA dehydrogenase family protein [Acidimicrobiales bacterium]|nr:acyl-CoA dehydrogenase family protein [Acidimicrobiales bacterium]
MDLTFTPAQQSFRAELRSWLEAHVPEPGSLASLDTAVGFEQHRQWEHTMAADRWTVVNWPADYGGRDLGIFEWLIFEEEYYRAQAPKRVSQNGIFLLAPTLLEFGTAEQKARFLPPMASGEEIWCQGWSEPDAGSDLAGIRSRAVRAPGGGPTGEDGWRLTGQKTWSSRGAFAEWCFGIFRTDPDAERHRGLTYFLIPMDADGVTVRPIPQLDGETGFAEIFFEDVFVPDDQILGGVGDGWKVAMSTAGSERGLSLRSPARYTEAANRLVALYDRQGRPAGRIADDVARAYVNAQAYELGTYWMASRAVDGHPVGAEASCNKIFWSETDLDIHTAGLSLLGPDAELLVPDPHATGGMASGPWLDGYLFALAGPIYAGTNEIQRNVVAERLLGLPRG